MFDFERLDKLIHEKGLPQDRVMEAVANALLAAYRKGIGGGENVRLEVLNLMIQVELVVLVVELK